MIKTCHVCNHTGELTWRDGKYYCAMCGTEMPENVPQVQPQHNVAPEKVVCPICKNSEQNLLDGDKYRCALCGTSFELHQQMQSQIDGLSSVSNPMIQELKKQKDRHLTLAVVFLFLFWPVSIYYFWKQYKTNQELKAMGYTAQSDPTQKSRPVLKGISIFCWVGAVVMFLAAIADTTIIALGIIYSILGAMFLVLSKTPKGSTYLLGKEKGLKPSIFICICVIAIFASVIIFAA